MHYAVIGYLFVFRIQIRVSFLLLILILFIYNIYRINHNDHIYIIL